MLIKNSQYEFKPAKEVNIPKRYQGSMQIIAITNVKDKIIQKAMSVLLEIIYEDNGYFHDESHGFRPNRGLHTALQQIKYKWFGIPYYIKVNVNKAFDDINKKVLINILNENISDKRFTDLICAMYKVNILCPEGF